MKDGTEELVRSVRRVTFAGMAVNVGIAALKGRTLRDRARNLIEIAHPDFRDELKAEFEKRFNCKY